MKDLKRTLPVFILIVLFLFYCLGSSEISSDIKKVIPFAIIFFILIYIISNFIKNKKGVL